MKNNNKILNDLSSMVHGAVGTAMDAKREIESMISIQLEKLLQKMELVTKEEFDTVKAMLVKARVEQEELKSRIDTLENQLNSLSIREKSNK